jgi:hypothetical protein
MVQRLKVYYWMKRGHATQATGKGDPHGRHKQDVIGRLSNHSPPRKVAQGSCRVVIKCYRGQSGEDHERCRSRVELKWSSAWTHGIVKLTAQWMIFGGQSDQKIERPRGKDPTRTSVSGKTLLERRKSGRTSLIGESQGPYNSSNNRWNTKFAHEPIKTFKSREVYCTVQLLARALRLHTEVQGV